MFQSLFAQADIYKSVIALLAKKSVGLTRQEIVRALKLSDGGGLTDVLNNLCNCDFIRKYTAFGKVEREAVFQLTDLFSLFYLRFVKGYNGRDAHRWVNLMDTPTQNTWRGYAFEQVCLLRSRPHGIKRRTQHISAICLFRFNLWENDSFDFFYQLFHRLYQMLHISFLQIKAILMLTRKKH